MPSSRDSGDFRDSRYRDVRSRDDRDRRQTQSSSLTTIKRMKTTNSRESVSQSSRSQSSSKSTPEPKIDYLKTSMDAIKSEEEEAISRTAEQNLKEFRLNCNSIRDICNQILEVKNSTDKDKYKQLDALRIKGSLVFLSLKKLNRFDKYRQKDEKEKLQTVKQKVDCNHLQLQNLLYEVMQLQRQCKACLLFRSKDEFINLVPLNQFHKEADDDLKQKATDEHKTHLARLEWELRQRKELEKKLKNAEEVKKKLEDHISNERDTLEKLPSMLKSVIDATQPLYCEFKLQKSDASSEASLIAESATEPDPECVKTSMEAIKAEEQQALNTPIEELIKRFKARSSSFIDICKQVLNVKNSSASSRDAKINALRMKGSLELLDLIRIERLSRLKIDDAQDKEDKAKVKVDALDRQLQTVSYALRHYQRKYQSCLTFKSKDERINLVPLEQFMAEADEDLRRMAIDDHSTHLARLEWELRQRQQLEEKLKTGEESKKSLEEQIVSDRETLERLQSMLKTVIEETQPLYSELNIPQEDSPTETSVPEEPQPEPEEDSSDTSSDISSD